MRGGDGVVIDVAAREIAGAPDTALVVTPHPMTVQGQRVLDVTQAPLHPGENLSTFLGRHGVAAGQQWSVSLGGVEVPEARWHLVRPKHGHVIEARRVPGKQVLMIVAIVALIWVTAGIGAGALAGTLGTGFAAGTVGASIASGLVMMAGTMVINKLLGPKPVSSSGPDAAAMTYSLQGGRNRARQFEPIGLVLGQPYCVPDLSAQPYVFFGNDEQFLWQSFHAGINCARVSDLRIGQTAIGSYEGVTLSYDGMASGNTGFQGLATSVDTIAGGLLDSPGGAGVPVVRTTSANTVQFAIDLEFQLSSMNSKGKYVNTSVIVFADYRPVGAADWTRWDTWTVSSSSAKPLRRTFLRTVPSGQYDVRLTKATPNATASTAQNVVGWTSLKSMQADTGNYAGQSRVAVQVKATGQLNGALDELNWVATAKAMPYWDGAQWTVATSRANGLCNPGAQILLLARGIFDPDGRLLAGLGMPDSQIDIESLKGFMVHCAGRGFQFDYFLQQTISIGDLIDSIAAAGMGSRSWHTGKIGVIWFSDSQPVEGVLNMTTIKAKSFSVDYDTQATAEEIEFQYFDRERGNSWQSIRVLAPGVVTPTSTARQQLVGVSVETHAAVLARFSMAQNVYQRKTVNCEVDLEHLVFRRGTIVALSHDVTQWGYGGRLQGFSSVGGVVTLALDDAVPSSSPTGLTSRYVGLRLPGERAYRVFAVQAFSGETRTIRLVNPWPAGATMPGAAGNPVHDTIWIFDFKATPGQKLRVAEISPQGNMDGARLALVPESPEFWNYVWNGTYAPPPNNSLLGQDRPSVMNMRVSAAPTRVGDGWVVELTVNFDVIGNYGSAQVWAGADGNELQRIGGDVFGGRASWTVDRGQDWTIEVRPFDTLGRVGGKGTATYHIAELAPDLVDGFAVAVEAGGVVARWTAPVALASVDWSATQIRRGLTWETGAVIFEGRANSYVLGWLAADDYTYWAAHRNTAGDWSAPVRATLTILPPAQPVVEGDMQGKYVQIDWQDCKTTQPLVHYRVAVGPALVGAAVVGFPVGTTFSRLEPEAGLHRYWVVPVDVAGNEGAPGYVVVESYPTLDEAVAALEEGLDETVAILNHPVTGLGATNVIAKTAEQKLALEQFQRITQNDVLAQTSLRAILQQHGDDTKQTQAVAAARQELSASVTEVDGRVTATAEALTELGAQVGDNFATVNEQLLVLVEENGRLVARWGVAVTVNGRVSGVVLNAEGGMPSSFVVLADKFAVAFPNDGAGEVYPFIVGSINGVPAVVVNANLFVDGGIFARHISSDSIETRHLMAAIIEAVHVKAQQIQAQHLAADSITAENGAIKDLSVQTLKIAGYAINAPVAAISNSAVPVTFVEQWTTLQSLSISATGLGFIKVEANCFMEPGTTGGSDPMPIVPPAYRILRNGVLIMQTSGTVVIAVDEPGAGVFTYTYQAMWAIGSTEPVPSASFRLLVATEVKR